MKRFAVLLATFLCVAAIALGQKDDHLADLPPILRKSMLAHRTSRYSGERTVSFKHGADRPAHTEYILKDGEKTRIEFPDDSPYRGQIIVEDGKQRLHYFPDRNEIEVEPTRDRGADRIRSGAPRAERHTLTSAVQDGGNVAGYRTQLITLSDQDGNALQQLWIEPKTGVVLKRVLYDKVGTQIGSSEFTKINFKPRFAQGDFVIDRKGALIVTPAMQARRLAEKSGLTPLTVPASFGFELESARIIHPDKKDVLMLSYVNDSDRFTLFQLRGDIDPDRLQRMAHGRLSTYSWKRGEESFALIGSLTKDQLQQIARTLGDG